MRSELLSLSVEAAAVVAASPDEGCGHPFDANITLKVSGVQPLGAAVRTRVGRRRDGFDALTARQTAAARRLHGPVEEIVADAAREFVRHVVSAR